MAMSMSRSSFGLTSRASTSGAGRPEPSRPSIDLLRPRAYAEKLPTRAPRLSCRTDATPGGPHTRPDWALDGPIPWRAAACRRAGTIHLGGTLEEIAGGEADVDAGRSPERPFVLLAQPSLFDPSRAPVGCHTGWAYCHVPLGSTEDMTERIEAQVERFAPGFRSLILARHVSPPAALQQANPNEIDGDIGGGSNTLWQLLARPILAACPYATPLPGLYLCSSSTPPGGG